MKTIRALILLSTCSLAPVLACGGSPEEQTPASTQEITAVTDGLPGGGHQCCWRTGFWGTIVNPPNCPAPSVPLTPQNLTSHCACAPIQLWC